MASASSMAAPLTAATYSVNFRASSLHSSLRGNHGGLASVSSASTRGEAMRQAWGRRCFATKARRRSGAVVTAKASDAGELISPVAADISPIPGFLSRRAAVAMVLASVTAATSGGVARADEERGVVGRGGAESGEDGILRRFYRPDGEERATNPYSLLVPRGWKRLPVTLNDAKLYGLDARFASPPANATPVFGGGGGGGGSGGAGAVGGPACVVDVLVLPVGNADKASIEEIGDPEDAIAVFGPPDQPMRVLSSSIAQKPSSSSSTGATTYYHYELTSPPMLMSAYVTDSQLYVFQVSAPGLSKRQWRESFYLLEAMRDSFSNEMPAR